MSNKKQKIMVKVVCNKLIEKDIYDMWIQNKSMADIALSGQFVVLYSNDGSRLLPRPISICEIDHEKGMLRLIYRVVGQGTKEFSLLSTGDKIEIMGPLGNGFTKKDGNINVIVGGGIGIPPLLELAKQLKGEKHIFLGYRDEVFLADEFKKYGEVYIATENGSVGTKGNVMTMLTRFSKDIDHLYACGPDAMLKALQKYALLNSIDTQLSLEEHMACGIGACLGCVCNTKEGKKKRICKDGPVFNAEEVEL